VGEIQTRREIAIVAVVLFLFSCLFVGVTTAEDAIENRVEASIDIELESATDLHLSATLDVNEITVFDTVYTKAEINTIATGNPEVLGAIKLRLRDLLKNQIKGTFANAGVTAAIQIPRYEGGLFHDEFTVNLTSAFFGMNDSINAHDFVNGVLDMDGIAAYTMTFQAEPGWNTTYTVILPNSMIFRNTTGTVSGNRIEWKIRNWDGAHPSEQGWLSLQFVTPTTPKTASEDIALEFDVDASDVETTALAATVVARAIDIRNYGIVPDFITNLEIIPADGMRLFIANGFTSWNALYQETIDTIENSIVSTIENSSFNQTVDMLFGWDPKTTTNCSQPYNITHMDDESPIQATLTDDDVALQIVNLSSRAVFGLTNAGASGNLSTDDINFGDRLDEIGYAYDGFLHLPMNITLAGDNIYKWNASHPLSGTLVSDIAPSYSDEEITIYVEIDITAMDLSVPSFFTGKTELTASTYTQENVNLYVTTLPEEFSLPEKLQMEYLNSDAFRVCTEEQVFRDEDINAFLAHKKQLFETRVSTLLNVKEINGRSDRNIFLNSLTWDGDLYNMEGSAPVIVSSNAHCIYPVPVNISAIPPSFNIFEQKFHLAGLEDSSITYRILFPNGITVEASDTLNKSIVSGETKDGQRYIELSFDVNETQDIDVVTCTFSASPLYVLGLFLPCILSLILVIILIIVLQIIRKKRGKKKAIVREEEPTEEDGYEGQDYYVPPPPSSG